MIRALPKGVTWLGLWALVGIALVAGAADGRDFGGSWRVENVMDFGDDVALTLRLSVHNHSHSDVVAGTITVADSLVPGQIYWSFYDVAAPNRESVDLRSDVLVPRAEYEYWAIGGHPHMQIEFMDATGDVVSRTIELGPMRQGEE